MRILTNANDTYEINEIPDSIGDIRYCVLDYSDIDNVDYYFLPLVFLESFTSPAVDLRIGQFRLQMPMDWSLIIGDPEYGHIEVMSIKHINDRAFKAFCFNPIGTNRKGYIPSFKEVDIVNIFHDVKWYFPKLKNGHILCVALEAGPNPECAYFVKEVNRVSDSLDISLMV